MCVGGETEYREDTELCPGSWNCGSEVGGSS